MKIVKKEKENRISLRLDLDLISAIENAQIINKCSRSEVIRSCILDSLSRCGLVEIKKPLPIKILVGNE